MYDVNSPVNITFNDFYRLLIYRILTCDAQQLGTILSATEGLENRVKKAAVESVDMESLIRAVLSKRYTRTRIQRLFSHILIGLDKDSFGNIMDNRINYARVLGFSEKGAALLKKIKKAEWNRLPILTNINREISRDSSEWKLLKFDITASDIYNLTAYGETYTHSDFVMKPFRNF